MKSPETINWLKLAQEDHKTAAILFANARHPHAIYHYCQAIEKLLKAALTHHTNKTPPKIHDLERLADLSTLKIDQEYFDNLTILNTHYKRVRYVDLAQAHYNTKKKVGPIINQAEESYKWLLQQFKKLSNNT